MASNADHTALALSSPIHMDTTMASGSNGRSIRGPAESASDSPPPPTNEFEDDTFTQMLSIHVDQPIGSMSISPANRDVALGARKGLYIVDLQNPYDPPRFLPHNSAWEVADVQWNPFPARSEWVASTSAQQAVIYNLSFSPSFATSHIEHTLQAHSRAVTDINWSPGSPEVLATCALDGWVWSWDLRTGYGTKSGAGGGRKPVWGVCSWGSGATQVKWNRREPHIIASAHDNKVMIWDDRMGAAPVTEIHGHNAKIYGIDWSRKDSKKIVTCSLDKSFKSWNIYEPSTSLLSVQTSSPVWRARFLPFGEGVLTLPQRSDHALSIWGREKVEKGDTAEPVARFEGAREGVKEFVWRTRGPSSLDNDDRSFQLVTWAKDRRLRLWPISDEILKEVGHVRGSKIDIPVTRRGAPNISYRTFSETPAPVVPFSLVTSPAALHRNLPAAGPSLLSASLHTASPPTPSLLTSSLLAASFQPVPSPLAHAAAPPPSDMLHSSATMTTTRVRNRKQKAQDRLAWMEGVKVIKPQVATEIEVAGGHSSNKDNGQDDSNSTTHTRSSSLVRGTDGGTAREGGDTERAESHMSPASTKTGTAVGRETHHANLGEEITSVVRRFPRVNFEKVHVAGRTCTVSLYSPLFLRATFHFPKNYPHTAAPTIELERSADIPLKSRAFLLQSIRKLLAARCQRGLPSLELALRFLLGDRTSFDHKPQAEDDDEDDVDEEVDVPNIGSVASEILRNNFNVPPPKRGGAVFGPQGQLVCFFPTNVFVDHKVKADEARSNLPTSGATQRPIRVSEAFGKVQARTEDSGYQETDEALQMASAHSLRITGFFAKPAAVAATQADSAPTFSSVVHIKDVSHLTLLRPDRLMPSLNAAPLDVAREAVVQTFAVRDLFLAKVWTTIVCLLESAVAVETGGPARQLETLFAERLLPELLSFLVKIKDLQTLGIIACLLESYSRSAARNRPPMPPRVPTDDYFSHPVSRSARASSQSDYESVRTPLASAHGHRQQLSVSSELSHSPKPSWPNLTGFFNASVLPARTSSPSTPVSPDKPPPMVRAASSSVQLATQSPGLPHPSPLKSPLRPFQQQPQHRSSDSLHSDSTAAASARPPGIGPAPRQASRTRSKGSPNVTFGTTSIALISGKGVVSSPSGAVLPREVGPKKRVAISLPETRQLRGPICWWLTESARLELELLRLAYAELLYRWGMDHERLEVLKHCRSTQGHTGQAKGAATQDSNDFGAVLVQAGNGFTQHTRVDLTRACAHCGAALISASDANCQICHRRQRPELCSLCHLPVETLAQSCTICHHVGHLDCMQTWWTLDQQESCASGCGCDCLRSGGLSGKFLVANKPAPRIPTAMNSGSHNSLEFRRQALQHGHAQAHGHSHHQGHGPSQYQRERQHVVADGHHTSSSSDAAGTAGAPRDSTAGRHADSGSDSSTTTATAMATTNTTTSRPVPAWGGRLRSSLPFFT